MGRTVHAHPQGRVAGQQGPSQVEAAANALSSVADVKALLGAAQRHCALQEEGMCGGIGCRLVVGWVEAQ